MKKVFAIAFITSTLLFTACGGNKTNQNDSVNNNETSTEMSTDTASEVSYDLALIDNKKDPTCGMPTSAGVTDTAHYDGKVLGFCAKECKEEFLKNPKANIAAAELKK
ncbi:MAG: YHS domain-containing protein [Sediminibacterium sp.]